MPGVLDNFVAAGLETTYGTPVAVTDGIEAEAHNYSIQGDIREAKGFRPGSQGTPSDRNVLPDDGSAFDFKFDVLTKGFGFWMQFLLGTITGPTQIAATTAHESTAATAVAAPGKAFTFQSVQHDNAGTPYVATHRGAVLLSWSLAHTIGSDNLTLSGVGWSKEKLTNIAAGAPSFPVGALPFDGDSATGAFTMDGGSNRCVRSFQLDCDLNLIPTKCMDGTSGMKEPRRVGFPTLSGNFSIEWTGTDLLDQYKAAQTIPIDGLYQGAEIEAGHNFELGIDMPECLITSDPLVVHQPGASDVPLMNVPYKVQHNGTDDMVTMRYKSTDTSL